jgi:hypothetical protein
MSDMTLFENNALANSDLFKSLQDVNDNLLSGASDKPKKERRRISLEGGKFREYVNGEQLRVSKEDSMDVVIVNAAPLSKTYYEGAYVKGEKKAPTCWSTDTRSPSDDVPKEQRQHTRCADCPQSVKGSGQGNSAACRFNQRIAVAAVGDLKHVYQLQLAATSIFGNAKNVKKDDGTVQQLMPMQAYAKHLAANNTPALAIVTRMVFDEDSPTPKLFFRPIRGLEESELESAVALKDDPATIDAITLSVAQTDGVQPVAIPFETPKKEEPEPSVEAQESAPVEEPKKVVKKKAEAKPAEDDDLSSIIDDWDD